MEGNGRKFPSLFIVMEESQIEQHQKTDVQMLVNQIGREHGHTTANRTLELLRAVINKGIQWGMFKLANPTVGVQKFKLKPRERFLHENEIQRLFAVLNDEANDDLKDYIYLSLSTGARKSNVLSMRWENLDLDNRSWIIPDTKNGTEHTILLTEAEHEILRRRRCESKSFDWVFPSNSVTGYLLNPKRSWHAILKKADIENLHMHDLRRSLGSYMAMAGASLSVIDQGQTLVSEIAKKFYELVEGKKPESDSAEAQKQVQVDGVAHNRQEQKKQQDFKEAGRTNSEPRNKNVSGFFGRVELIEETPDGKTITHVKGVPAPAFEAPSVKIGTTDYKGDQIVAHDWGAISKKAFDVVSHAVSDQRFLECENPVKPLDVVFPHQGREDKFMDYQACKYANAAFPNLSKHIGDQPQQIDPHLIAAVIRNEQFFYKNLLDTGPDHVVNSQGHWTYGAHETIGPAQIRISTINHLAEKYPEVLGPAKTSVISAEDIHRAPFFVGAYFAYVIQGVEQNHKPEFISRNIWNQIIEKWHNGKLNDALIISYNPNPEQVNHVGTQLKIVKEKHPN
ncbi:unnamed protein product [Sphagnum balticum]